MDWDHLRIFLAMSRAENVSRAAQALGLSRATIHRRVDALEASTGVSLFERTHDGWHLTSAGAQLLPRAERVEQEALGAERLLASQDFALTGTLALTTFELTTLVFAPIFVQLQHAHPEVDLRVYASNRILSLHRRECDLAIRATSSPSPSLFGRLLGQMPYAVYGLASFLGEENPPWILWDEERGAEKSWSLAHQYADPLRVAMVVDSFHMMLAMACAGAGVALLPVAIAETHPELAAWGPVPEPGMELDIWLLTHQDLRHSPRVRAVMRFLATRISETLTSRR